MTRSLLMVAPEWPKYDSGYSLALQCALKLYRRHYAQIFYLGVSRRACDAGVISEFPEVRFLECRRPVLSRGRRFIRSLAKSTPAILEDYDSAQIFEQADRAVASLAAGHDGPPDVIVEDALLGWLLACQWPGRKRIRRLALRSHNVLGELFEDFSREGPPWRRWAWRHEVRRVQIMEAAALAGSDAVWTITNCDRDKYRERYGCAVAGVIDFGMEPPAPAPAPERAPNVLYFGTADLRKGHGLAQFVAEAWPRVRAAVPNARFLLGGRGTEAFSNPALGIEGAGFVRDENQFYARGQVLVNPQLRGSGIKIKSIMAMFAGRALVITPKGAEGLLATAGEDFILPGSMPEMGDAVIALLRDNGRADTLAQNARARALQEYRLEAFYNRCDAVVDDFTRKTG